MSTRLEKVIVDLDDRASRPMARMAVSAEVLARCLDGADGRVRHTDAGVDQLSSTVRRGGADIDRYSGRLRLLAQGAAVFGPALIPITAVGIPALSGLAASAGFAAVAGGTVVAAFQGVGEALETVNKAALEPTEENLEAARKAMADLSPQARDLVRELRDWIPALKELRDTAAAGLFPGLTEGLDGLEGALPRVERILDAVSTELGDIAADAGESLGGERWADFLDFVAKETPPALRDMATATGNIAHAMSELWEAFDPLNDDFLGWLVTSTDKLDEWAEGLSKTEGFEDFVAYIRENGPQVAETLGALGTALVDIVEAASPLGGPALRAIEGIAKAVSAVADSDMGTPIFAALAAVSALNIALSATRGLAATATGALGTVGLAGGVGGGGGRRGAGKNGGKHRADGPDGKGSGGRRSGGGRGGTGAGGVAAGAVLGLGYLTEVLDGVGSKGQETGDKLFASFDKPKGGVAEFLFGPGHTMQADFKRALDGLDAGSVGKIGQDLDNAFGGSSFSRGIDNVRALDDQLSNLARSNPAAAMDAYYTATRKSGLSTAELAKVLPKSTKLLKGQAKATGDVGTLLRQAVPQLAEYDRVLRGFPPAAITEIATTGLPETRKDIVDLTAKYNLTPRQVRTLIEESGGTPTKAMIDRIIARAEALSRQRPKPKISAQDSATGVIAAVRNGLINLNGQTATTFIRTVRIEERRSVASGTNAYTSGVGGGADGGRVVAMAGGGTVPGQRMPYGDKIYIFAAPGEEVITNRNGEADRFRADRAAGRIPHYADGGTIQALAGGGRVRGRRRRNRPSAASRARQEALKGFRSELAKSRDALASERSAREELTTTVRDSFRTELFGGQSSVWGAGSGDPRATLRADLAKADAFQKQLAALRKQGASGALLAEVAASGDINKAAGLSALGTAGIRETQALYEQRARASQAVGNYAGNAAYGEKIASLDATAKRLEKTVKQMQRSGKKRDRDAPKRDRQRAQQTGQAVNKGARAGKKRRR